METHDPMSGQRGPSGDGVPEPGTIIAGKYQVERVLGRGGMGVVVSAWHTSLRQRVAIKFLLPSAAALPEASGRFLREAQSASAIRSEHVARVLDVGTLETGSPYMIMEYLTGSDVGALIRSRGALPIKEAIDYTLQACDAIAEAHALRIVHRDLKPSNLFLTSRPDGSPLVKVLDFGLSKAAASHTSGVPEASLTATNDVVGSPHYMSPEQMRSLKRVDARTDIWSLGVILYELLAGRRPFVGESIPAVFASIAADQPPPLRSLRADIPPALEKIVLRCLEKDMSLRVQTVAELARALMPFGPEGAGVLVQRISKVLAGAGDTSASQPGAQSAPVTSDSTTAGASAWSQTKKVASHRVFVGVAAGAATLALVVAAAFVLVSRARPAAEDQAVAPAAEAAPRLRALDITPAGEAPSPVVSASPSATPAGTSAAGAGSASPSSDSGNAGASPTATASAAATALKASPGTASPPPSKPTGKAPGKASAPDKMDRWD